MEVKIQEFKVRDVVEAVEENGFRHLRGQWFYSYGGSLKGGCVLGQAALNLSVFATESIAGAKNINDLDPSRDIYVYGLVNQLNKFPIDETNKWYDSGSGETTAGSLIIHWNDKQEYNSKGNRVWSLRSYKAVAKMVREVLAPFMDETIKLAVIDYSEWNPVKVK